jgi:AraC-like DNA-binding protein
MDPSFPFHIVNTTFQNYFFHWHELVEVIYISIGKIVVSVGGTTTVEACKGDIVIITPNSIHGFYNAVPGTVVSIFHVGLEIFDQSIIDLRDREMQILVFSNKIYVKKKEDPSLHKRLEKILLEIQKEYINKGKGYHLAIKAKLFEFALVFLREIPAQLPVPGIEKRNYYREILERLFSFIHENADDPEITLRQAADIAAFSKFYFTRFFKEQTGQTFHTYLSRVRISHVEEYLVTSDLSITDIAYKCGFSSLKTFNRLFKTYTGLSPSEYRTIKRRIWQQRSQ